MRGVKIANRVLKVEFAGERQPGKKPSGWQGFRSPWQKRDVPTRSLYVANIPPQITADDLRDYFEWYGGVDDVKLLRQLMPTKAAFVDFHAVGDAVAAFRGDNLLFGNRLRVDYNKKSSGKCVDADDDKHWQQPKRDCVGGDNMYFDGHSQRSGPYGRDVQRCRSPRVPPPWHNYDDRDDGRTPIQPSRNNRDDDRDPMRFSYNGRFSMHSDDRYCDRVSVSQDSHDRRGQYSDRHVSPPSRRDCLGYRPFARESVTRDDRYGNDPWCACMVSINTVLFFCIVSESIYMLLSRADSVASARMQVCKLGYCASPYVARWQVHFGLRRSECTSRPVSGS